MYIDPSESDLQDPLFNATWEAIKLWDISRDIHNSPLRSSASGNDVMHILVPVREVCQKFSTI